MFWACDTFKASLSATITLIGFWYGFLNFLLYIPLAFFPAAILTTVVYFLRIPPPSCAQLQRVVGKPISSMSSDNCKLLVMKSVAHRGAGFDAPENTLQSFKQCAEKGCNFVHFNVTLTADEVPVLFHDDNLEKLAGLNLCVNKTRYEDLKKVDVSKNHPLRNRYPNSKIPTLEEAVKFLMMQEQHMFIDIKDNNRKMVEVILNLFKAYPQLVCRAVVSSYNPIIIYLIRRGNPRIVCSLKYRPHCFSYRSHGVDGKKGKCWCMSMVYSIIDVLHTWFLPRITYNLLGISLLLLHKDSVSKLVMSRWMNRGVRVIAWTVNHPIEKQYFFTELKCSYLTDTLVAETTNDSTSRI